MENMDTSMEEFFGAFEGADGNQTDTEEVTAENEPAEETVAEESAQEGVETSESVETAEEEQNQEADKDGADGEPEPKGQDSEQKFTVKVNSETREVSYQDAPAWIQKGMDYDRVKGQLETERQTVQDLNAKIAEQQEYMDTLNLVSETAKIPIAELLERLHVNAVKKEGQTEAEVRAQIRADKLERQLKAQNTKQEEKKQEEDRGNARMERELQEFRAAFPEVKVDEALAEKLGPDIRAGMSLTSAYLKMENQRLQTEMQQQKQKEAAAKNKENRMKAPGSQRDSGGQRMKTAEDDFFAAFEK